MVWILWVLSRLGFDWPVIIEAVVCSYAVRYLDFYDALQFAICLCEWESYYILQYPVTSLALCVTYMFWLKSCYMLCCIDVYCIQMQDNLAHPDKTAPTWCVTIQVIYSNHCRKPDCVLLCERWARLEESWSERIHHNCKLRDGIKGRQDVHQHLFTHKRSHFYRHFYCINVCLYVHYYVYYNVLLGFRFVYRPSVHVHSIPSDVKKYVIYYEVIFSIDAFHGKAVRVRLRVKYS